MLQTILLAQKMKSLILLLVGVMIAAAKADSDFAEVAASDAKILGKLLKKNWTVLAKGNEVTLTSKFELFHIGMISRSAPRPDFSDKTPEAELLAETKPTRYVIRLRYEDKISKEELERRRTERQKAADILTHGARTKDAYGKAGVEYAKIRVPRYQSFSCHIYEELPDSPFGRFYPPKAVQKVGGAKEILSVLLGRIRSAND